MLALTVHELLAITAAVFAILITVIAALARETSNLRERVTRVEESVRWLRNTLRKED